VGVDLGRELRSLGPWEKELEQKLGGGDSEAVVTSKVVVKMARLEVGIPEKLGTVSYEPV